MTLARDSLEGQMEIIMEEYHKQVWQYKGEPAGVLLLRGMKMTLDDWTSETSRRRWHGSPRQRQTENKCHE